MPRLLPLSSARGPTGLGRAAAVALATSGLLLSACGTPTVQRRDAAPPATPTGTTSSASLAPAPAPPMTTVPAPRLKRSSLRARVERLGADKNTATEARRNDNPLDRPFGVYKGAAELVWPAYESSTGAERDLLARLALTPKAKWFGAWIPNADVASKVDDYIANSQAGDPDALVQMTFFRLQPWEHDACRRQPTPTEASSYRDWVDKAASAIGSTHTAIVLQPDGPFALCVPGGPGGVSSDLTAYSARVLSALPNTSVYIEIGSDDWPTAAEGGIEGVMRFLIPSGIEYARGIALNATHYSATSLEVGHAAAVIEALAGRGITGKHAVINTADNGHPFVFGSYRGSGSERIADNARVCQSASAPAGDTCTMLGIPPTTDVADARWGLDDATDALATKYVDAYLWFGRPWLYFQNQPFLRPKALTLARTWPYVDAAGF